MHLRPTFTVALVVLISTIAGFGGSYAEHAWERHGEQQRLPEDLRRVQSEVRTYLRKTKKLNAKQRLYLQYLQEHPDYAATVSSISDLESQVSDLGDRVAETESGNEDASSVAEEASGRADDLESTNEDLQNRLDELEFDQQMHELDQDW